MYLEVWSTMYGGIVLLRHCFEGHDVIKLPTYGLIRVFRYQCLSESFLSLGPNEFSSYVQYVLLEWMARDIEGKSSIIKAYELKRIKSY